jgi:group I intron endonuclease
VIVYLATNGINGKRYVGITVRPLSHRISCHLNSPNFFGKALRKYGKEAFKFEVIDRAENEKELSQKEQYWIARLNTMVPSGYNLTTGGERGFKKHPMTIRKMTERKRKYYEENSEIIGKQREVGIKPSSKQQFHWGVDWSDVKGGANGNKARQIRKILRRWDPTIGSSIREQEHIRRMRQKVA